MTKATQSLKQWFETSTLSKLRSELVNMPLQTLIKLRWYYADAYYNSDTKVEDYRYDLLVDVMKNRDVSTVTEVGVKLRDEEIAIKLPCYMGSMDKVKPNDTKEFNQWMSKNSHDSYIVSDKLDGVSGLLEVKNGKYSLYTRADGTTGKDVSYILNHIKGIPPDLPDILVRGELVMSKTDFSSYDGPKVNPRNTVSGAVKAKTIQPTLCMVKFVAYELIDRQKKQRCLSQQLQYLNNLRFTVVHNTIQSSLSIESLRDILKDRVVNGEYEIDGIIIHSPSEYIRDVDKNPVYALAFKEDIFTSTIVKDVVWRLSKSGFLKPRILLEPVFLSGATISCATGFNGLFISENKIGPGTEVMITRSGEVIPKVVDVLNSTGAKMPDCDYEWNNNHVEVIAINPDSNELNTRIIKHFMSTMKIKYISDATITKLVESGYDTVQKILDMKVENFECIEGFKSKSAERCYNSIHTTLQNSDLSILMAASNCFGHGIGVKRLKLLIREIPNLVSQNEVSIEDICNVEGFSTKTAEKIVTGLKSFGDFYTQIQKYIKFHESTNSVSSLQKQIFEGKKFVCSGFRKLLDEDIESRGGELTTSVSKKVFCVIVKDKNDMSAKIRKAREIGIPIYTIEEFDKAYLH